MFQVEIYGEKISSSASATVIADRGNYSSCQMRNVDPVTPVQRCVIDGLRADRLTDRRCL